MRNKFRREPILRPVHSLTTGQYDGNVWLATASYALGEVCTIDVLTSENGWTLSKSDSPDYTADEDTCDHGDNRVGENDR